MKKYFSYFKMRMISVLQYRAAAWAGIFTQFFFGFAYIMIYLAFYRGSKSVPPMPIEQLITYQWLFQALLGIFFIMSDDVILTQIESGQVAYEFTKPYDLFTFWYFKLIATKLATTLLRFFPIIIVCMFLPKPYTMMLPASLSDFLLFIVSLSFSLLLVGTIIMFIYILTFKTLSAMGPKILIGVIAEFLMGGIIPFPLMPDLMKKILSFLPFKYIIDLPFNIYLGNILVVDALSQMLIQVLFIIIMFFAGRLLFNKVCKKVIIQGG